MLSLYLLIYIVVALFSIFIFSIKKKDISFMNETVDKIPWSGLVVIKAIPATLAVVFALTMSANDTLFHIGMALALFFCVVGDVGMEIKLISGLSLFAIAQVLFILVYTGQALFVGITPESLLITAGIVVIAFAYVILFLKYLMTSEKGLGKLKNPVLMYSAFLSLHLCTATLLWATSGFVLEGMVIAIGALFFLISDSTIGVREFHHEISYNAIKVLGTYYFCILLISLGVLYY